MKVKKLILKNFRRFSDFDITFDEQLTVLVARNGAGKSSVLDGVAISLGAFLTRLPKVTGITFKNSDLQVFPNGTQPPYVRITCESFDGQTWDRSKKRDEAKKTEKQIPKALGLQQLNDFADQFIDAQNEEREFELPIFIHYGTGRGVFDVPQRTKGFGNDFTRFGALSGALESRTNFRRFVEYFYTLEDKEAQLYKKHRSFDIDLPELKAIRMAIHRLMPEFSNPRAISPAGIMIDWKNSESSDTKQLRIEQLSDGYRTTLAMVMDIAARMAEANPDMPDPLQTEGVVMIDEVDLHLHPGWQQTILSDLVRTFPQVQFIVSTHSPQIVSTVKPTQIRVIDWQDEEPSLMPIYFSEGAEFQQVLMDVLGVKSPRAEHLEIVKSLRKYQQYVENNQWDCEDAINLRKELDGWAGEHESELSNLDMDISIRELDR
ncbi:AAA family ATPase [Vibrio sp. 10N.247.311.51]|uniref:AAA family ATPase n=1 Tax=Vibrio sp. 10N.247.311.51 TaxID=3229996 RepID=UPI00354E8CF4